MIIRKLTLSLINFFFLGTSLFSQLQPGWIWPIEEAYNWRFTYEASDGLLYGLRGDRQWMYSANAIDWSEVDGYPGTINGNDISVIPFYSEEFVPGYAWSSVFSARLNNDGVAERIYLDSVNENLPLYSTIPGIVFHGGYWWWGAMWLDVEELALVVEVYRSEDTYTWDPFLRIIPRNHYNLTSPILNPQFAVVEDRLSIKFAISDPSIRKIRLLLLTIDEEVPPINEVDWPNGEIFSFNDQLLANMGDRIVEAESGDLVTSLEKVPYTTYTPAGGLVIYNSTDLENDVVLIASAREPLATLVEISGSNFLGQFTLPVSGGIRGMCEGSDCYVMLGTEGEVIFSNNGYDWDLASLHLSLPGTIDYANGEYRIVTDSMIYSSSDGESWSEMARGIPLEANRFSPNGFGELAESEQSIWLFNEDNLWEWIGDKAGPVHYIPELKLAINQSIDGYSSDYIRGGERHASTNLLTYYSNGFNWSNLVRGTFYGTGIGSYDPIPPLDHQLLNTIDYGNGVFYSDWISSDLVIGHDLFENYTVGNEGYPSQYQYVTSAAEASRTREICFTGNRFVATLNDGRMFVTQEMPLRPVVNGFLTQNGWVGSDWFDWVNTRHYPWLYKWDLGWVLSYGGNASNCWFWDTTVGLFWTSRSHYPTVYTESEGWFRHPMARIR